MKILKIKAVLISLVVGLLGLAFAGCGSQLSTKNSNSQTIPMRLYEPERVLVEPLSANADADASKIVAAYNSRNFGSPGWRRVVLELLTDGAVTRTFTVVNLWRSHDDNVSTLFLLEEPKGLIGTNYLLREWTNKTPEMRVNLFLPAGEQRALEVAPSNFDEGLLGSDFSYNDIRMQLPLVGYRYTLVGAGVLTNEPVWVIEVVPSHPQSREMTSWSRANLYLARRFPFLLGADYYSENGAAGRSILKQMRVDRLKQIKGVWTAAHITMYGDPNRRSELTLSDAEFNSHSFDPKFLSPEKLQFVADEVRKGWTPGHTSVLRE